MVTQTRALKVAIVGAGMSGFCMAAKLQDAGIDTFTLFEKADELGGTWRDNTYPGLRCDVPSRYFSYTFRPNPDWSRFLSPGQEIQDYFRLVADERGIRSHIKFGTDVRRRDTPTVGGGWRPPPVRRTSTFSCWLPVCFRSRTTP